MLIVAGPIWCTVKFTFAVSVPPRGKSILKIYFSPSSASAFEPVLVFTSHCPGFENCRLRIGGYRQQGACRPISQSPL
jgi:hypothetical protein